VNTDEIWRRVDDQRIELAGLLEGLTPEQWTAQSLCDGWQVRGMTFPLNGQRHLAGVRLVATDVEFAAGEGREVQVPIGDIVMVLAGRAQP
jgi:hypothetical protein